MCYYCTYSAGDWVPAKGGIIAVEPIRDLPGADHRAHGVTVPQRLPNCYNIRYNLEKRKKSYLSPFCDNSLCDPKHRYSNPQKYIF
jgi:hypothetical protein